MRAEAWAVLDRVLQRYEIAYEALKSIALRPDCSEEIREICDDVTANEYTLDDIQEAYFLLKEG